MKVYRYKGKGTHNVSERYDSKDNLCVFQTLDDALSPLMLRVGRFIAKTMAFSGVEVYAKAREGTNNTEYITHS